MTNWTHQGYMDGLAGREPDPTLSSHIGGDYEAGWLAGSEDRQQGKPYNPLLGEAGVTLGLKKGTEYLVVKGSVVWSAGPGGPKVAGRSYKVKVDHTYSGSQAHHDYRGEFQRPTLPRVVWAGSGKYWHHVEVSSPAPTSSDTTGQTLVGGLRVSEEQ